MPLATLRGKGICYGTLWKQHCSSTTSKALEPSWADININERSKSYDYCVIVGNTLFSYPDISAFRQGDFPLVS